MGEVKYDYSSIGMKKIGTIVKSKYNEYRR